MAFFSGSVYSKEMDMETHVSVVLPYDQPADVQLDPCKTLYLLHGRSNNSTSWMRMSAVEMYARRAGYALVIPEVQRSFYKDMDYGLNYFSYVAKELPDFIQSTFRVSPLREHNFVAGLSMGGYGALKMGLTFPERFCACASFSGAVDLAYAASAAKEASQMGHTMNVAEMQGIFGLDLELKEEDDLFALASKAAQLPENLRPHMYVTCGLQDSLLLLNHKFKAHAETLPLDFVYEEWDGEHKWDFWDPSIKKAIDFFENIK